jgi:hypothetical protein
MWMSIKCTCCENLICADIEIIEKTDEELLKEV